MLTFMWGASHAFPERHTPLYLRRLGEGGCTAMLGPTGMFLDCAAVGHPQFCAPEVLRTRRGSQVQYSPPGGPPSFQPISLNPPLPGLQAPEKGSDVMLHVPAAMGCSRLPCQVSNSDHPSGCKCSCRFIRPGKCTGRLPRRALSASAGSAAAP